MTHQPEHDPLGDLAAAGVAVWLDDLSRELLAGGGLQSLVAVRHVIGAVQLPRNSRLGRFKFASSLHVRYAGTIKVSRWRRADRGGTLPIALPRQPERGSYRHTAASPLRG